MSSKSRKLRFAILNVDDNDVSRNGVSQVLRQAGFEVIEAASGVENLRQVQEALRSGAAGYVIKQSTSAELVRGVREVAAGRRYLSPPLSEYAIEVYMQKAKEATLDKYETLTTREREVLHLAAEGYSNREIAERLSISPHTAMTHRANLMRKLGLHSPTDLVRYALRRGIIPMEE